MERERMTISTAEYKELLEKKIRADLLWKRCMQMKYEDGAAVIPISEVQFQLNAVGNYDPFCGLPMEDVPQGNFDLQEDGRN